MKNKRMHHTIKTRNKVTFFHRMMSKIVFFMAISLMLAASLPGAAASEETVQPEGWQFGADVYFWISEIGGDTAEGDSIDVPFDTIVDNLDFAYMGAFHARNGRWHLSTDVIYMNLEDDNSSRVTLPGENEIRADATFKMESWIVTPVVGFGVIDTERIRLEVLAGARYLYLKPELKFDITGPLDSRGRRVSDSDSFWDGIIGIRGDVNLARSWYVPFYADIGTGDSDYTWQIMAGVGYRINKALDVVGAYRYLEWKFDDNKVLDNLDISGPLLGLRFRF